MENVSACVWQWTAAPNRVYEKRADFKGLLSWANGSSTCSMKPAEETSLLPTGELARAAVPRGYQGAEQSQTLPDPAKLFMILAARRGSTKGCLILTHQGISQGN